MNRGCSTLSREEQEKLWRAFKSKSDVVAREALINANIPLVGAIARKFALDEEEYRELFQGGIVGLIRAVDGFNPELGAAFSTYAFPHIHGDVLRQREKYRGVKRCRSEEVLLQKIKRAAEAHINTHQREAEPGELADILGESLESILWVMEEHRDYQEFSEETLTISAANDSYEIVENQVFFAQVLQELTAKERIILEKHYYENKTQKTIAAELHLSQAQISRLEKAALMKLKRFSEL